jgi:hypothetical protein
MFQAISEGERGEADELFSALFRVSERARVRVFADGRVVPIAG